MDKSVTDFLASARSCMLTPMEHAQIRAALLTQTQRTTPTVVLRSSSTALRLSDYEKAIGRAKLLQCMRTMPLEEPATPFFGLLFRPIPTTLTSVAMAVILLVGGGAAYAAENALPGDLLYPIKVHITEPVISRLTLTASQRAHWNIRTIERRLNEADALAVGSGTVDQQTILQDQMEQNALLLREQMRALPEKDKESVRVDLLSELMEHRKSIQSIQSAIGVPSALRLLVEDVASELQEPHVTLAPARPLTASGSVSSHAESSKEQSHPGNDNAPQLLKADEGKTATGSSSPSSESGSSSAGGGSPGERRPEKRERRSSSLQNAAQDILRLFNGSSSSSSSDPSSNGSASMSPEASSISSQTFSDIGNGLQLPLQLR